MARRAYIYFAAGSPMLPVLGYLTLAASFLASVYTTFEAYGFKRLRWVDVAAFTHVAFALPTVFIAITVAFNTAWIIRPTSLWEQSLGFLKLERKLLFASTVVALSVFAVTLLPILGLFLFKPLPEGGGAGSWLVLVIAAAVFCVTVSVFALIISRIFHTVNPFVAPVLAGLLAYFFVATSSSQQTLWVLSPIADNIPLVPEFLLSNQLLRLGTIAILFGFAVVVFICSSRFFSGRSDMRGVVGILSLVVLGGILQSVIGNPSAKLNDACTTTTSGHEICVNKLDESLLIPISDDIDRFSRAVPGHVEPIKMAEYNSGKIRENDPNYRYISYIPASGRVDLTNFAQEVVGIGRCEDLQSEGAHLLERFATYLIRDTGVYSKNVDQYGALYAYLDIGESSPMPQDIFSKLPPHVIEAFLADNWTTMSQCQGSFDLLKEYL